MKYKLLIICSVLTTAALLGCNGSAGSSKMEVNFSRDASYALGLNIGAGLKEGMEADGIFPNLNDFFRGMRDGIEGKNQRFDLDRARIILDEALDAMMEEMYAEARQAENIFLAENVRKPGIIITQSGLQYEIITEGSGPKPTEHDRVLVHYDGKFTDGRFFDSSHSRGYPSEFELSWIIPGWAEGLQLMSVGSKYRFYIRSELAYGEDGIQGIIPPFSTLIFDVELLEINPN
jgi:FKBP-type peptidyl-prolyl cis-trans isomerase